MDLSKPESGNNSYIRSYCRVKHIFMDLSKPEKKFFVKFTTVMHICVLNVNTLD